MVKRFAIGFAVGVGLMYWYVHHGGEFFAGAASWTKKSASQYSDDTARKAVDAEFGK
jgi:hypothetical protein